VANVAVGNQQREKFRFWLRSEDTLVDQVADPTTAPDGIAFEGPFPELPMVFQFNNQADASVEVAVDRSDNYDSKDHTISVTAGNIDETDTDATTTWQNIYNKTVVPLGQVVKVIDFSAIGNNQPPQALRFRLLSGTGPVLVEFHTGQV
jgi:hypothetical protein